MDVLKLIRKTKYCVFFLILKFIIADGMLRPIILSGRLPQCSFRYSPWELSFSREIVYGTPVNLSEFAHMAALGIKKRDRTESWHCGGSLISDNWVLSAAHCVSDNDETVNVARLGDRNPFTSLDDEFAQQFDVIDIKVHPNYKGQFRYFDLALFKLSGHIRPHKTVLPACLWLLNDTETLSQFSFEVIGFGASGFQEELTENVQKVTLKYVDRNKCDGHHMYDPRLPNGLAEHQMCAIGELQGDLRQDTCQGDSGGPLQVKLLANGRITSFIVGIVSFGKVCGFDDPGVYVQVSKFRDWIENVIGLDFEPRKCALRYAALREFQPGVVQTDDRSPESVKPLRTYMDNSKIGKAIDIPDTATLGFYRYDGKIDWFCGASLIDEKWLLTSASCLIKNPIVARIGDFDIGFGMNKKHGVVVDIERLIRYPTFDPVNFYNDIGLVILKAPVELSRPFRFACIWDRQELPVDHFWDGRKLPVDQFGVLGWGSKISNIFITDYNSTVNSNQADEVFLLHHKTVEDEFDFSNSEFESCDKICQVNKTKRLASRLDEINFDEIRLLEIDATILANDQCNDYFTRSKKPQKIIDSQVCFQNDLFVVPGICNLNIGGPIQRRIYGPGGYSSYVFAVTSYGDNCGFGSPIVATLVSPYEKWIKNIIVEEPKPKPISPSVVHFFDNDLDENNSCSTDGDSEKGICKREQDCQKALLFYQSVNQSVQFCSADAGIKLVCCPVSLLTPKICQIDYRQFPSMYDESLDIEDEEEDFPYLAAIGFLGVDNEVKYECWGALVSENAVITTASCITSHKKQPVMVEIQYFESVRHLDDKPTVEVLRTIVHENFIAGKPYYDIAVVRLKSNVINNNNNACLWSDERSPVIATIPAPLTTKVLPFGVFEPTNVKLLQKDDCELQFMDKPSLNGGVGTKLLCFISTSDHSDTLINVPGAVLVSNAQNYERDYVPLLIGLYINSTNGEQNNKVKLFTRISSYTGWIHSKL